MAGLIVNVRGACQDEGQFGWGDIGNTHDTPETLEALSPPLLPSSVYAILAAPLLCMCVCV